MADETPPNRSALPPAEGLRLCSVMSITDPPLGATTTYSSPVFLQVASCPAGVWKFLDG